MPKNFNTMDLTRKEQQLLAFALFITGMRIGPDVFETLESIAAKTGVDSTMNLYTEDWVNFSNAVKAADIQGKDFLQKFKK